MEGRLGRRGFLTLGATAAAEGALVLTGCSRVAVIPTARAIERSPTVEPANPEKEKLRKIINELPESSIKDLLVRRALFYYQNPRPQVRDFSGVKVSIDNATIGTLPVSEGLTFGGTYTMRSSVATREPLFPTKAAKIQIPYIGLTIGNEANTIFPPSHKAVDGTPLLEVEFPVDKPLYEGLSPEITLSSKDTQRMTPEEKKQYETYEKLAYVKEACGLALDDIWLEEVIKKMQELCLSLYIPVRRPNKSVVLAETITQAIKVLSDQNGRIVASGDIAAYGLGLKAVENTDMMPHLIKDLEFKNAYETIKDRQIGESDREIMTRALEWAITTPAARDLVHVGNINRIP